MDIRITLPKVNVFDKYKEIMGHDPNWWPRPQPSDFAAFFFKDQEGLFFVDVGAYDGIAGSNSLVLEDGYGWKGICIEPNPVTFESLKKYSDKYRKNSEILNIGISQVDSSLEFWQIEGYAASLSGFSDFFDDSHKKRVDDEISTHGGVLSKIQMLSKPLRSILSERGIKKVDYLSIDAEGADSEILKSIDFDSTEITLISVESDGVSEEAHEMLESLGYHRIAKVCADFFYAKNFDHIK